MGSRPNHVAMFKLLFGAAVIARLIGIEYATSAEGDPDLPAEILERRDAHFEGSYRAYPNRFIDRRPTVKIYPGEFEDSVLQGGPLRKLKEYSTITGLDLNTGPCLSSVSTDSFVVDITPEAIADIGALTHLESLTIRNVDLSRGDGLKFLESMNQLQEIDFHNCTVEVGDLLAHLPVCKHLRSIRLFYIPRGESAETPLVRRLVDAQTIQKLVEDSPNLSVVFLSTTEQYEPEAIAHFAGLKSLTLIHIVFPYHKWNKGLVAVERPSITSEQEAAVKKLKPLFQAKGMKEWVDPTFKQTYRLEACMIHTLE